MLKTDFFISCDWGTTNFRLRLVDSATLKVIETIKTDHGIKILYGQFLNQQVLGQSQFFADYLGTQILKLPVTKKNYPIILTGMASSSIGLLELDYATMPFNQSGEGLVWQKMTLDNGLEILLLSGVKSETGMMRGEETQAIGLGESLEKLGDGILILPGTHSKHISYSEGNFTSLKNFMTGELFEVLSNKSILSSSVKFSEWSVDTENAFREGLTLGLSGELTASLLMVRANDVVKNYPKTYNYYLLSGMLIGDELAYLKKVNTKVFLAASEPVFNMYKIALEALVDAELLTFFDSLALEKALLIGQKKILTRNGK